MSKELNDLELHPNSEYVQFLKDCNISATPEISMIYHLRNHYSCFICKEYIEELDTKTGKAVIRKNEWGLDKVVYTDNFGLYKEHFRKEHKDHNYFLYISDKSYDRYVEEITWNSSSILGLIDQLLVLENYKQRKQRYRGRIDPEIRFRNYANIGNTIIKIMKEWQIPQEMFNKFLNIPRYTIGKYTDAAYKMMKEEDRPQWMRNFL